MSNMFDRTKEEVVLPDHNPSYEDLVRRYSNNTRSGPARMSYLKDLHKKMLSPRTWPLFSWWSERRRAAMKASEEDEAQVKEDNIRHSRMSQIQFLVDNIDTLTEVRLMCEYGDYFALAVNRSKINMVWQEKRTWAEVVEQIEKERNEIIKHGDVEGERDSPYLQDLRSACNQKGLGPDLVESEILFYTEKNRVRHGGVKQMIDAANFVELGRKILNDRHIIDKIMGNHDVQQQERVLRALQEAQNEWYLILIAIPKAGTDGRQTLCFQLTPKGHEKIQLVHRNTAL